MTLTKEQFVDAWKVHLAGLALFGSASDKNDGPFTRASKVWEIPANSENMLRQMYDSIGLKPQPKLTTEEHVEAIGKAFKAMTEPEQKKLTDLIRKVIANGK